MSRPRSEAEYLARLVPASVAAVRPSRRSFLRAASFGAAALGAPAVLAACGSDDGGGDGEAAGGDASPSGTVTFGSNEASGAGRPFEQRQALVEDYQKRSGLTVKVNAVEHNQFQENINNYLQGSPDDVWSWFAGYRVKFFAEQGLVGDVSDIWPLEGVNEAFQKASTGNDGNQYFVPASNYPWAVFYRKSLWAERGYEVPATLDEFETLAKQMQTDKIVPVAFADKQGWPAMGTFDILNMRINGYDYHVNLMAGEESWESDQVKTVFDTWKGLLPYHQADPLGRDWEQAAQALQKKEAGMYLLGLFVTDQFELSEQADIDFFTFPEIDSNVGADAIDAPIDGYCMAAEPTNEAGAKDFLKYLASPEATQALTAKDIPLLATNSEADTSGYTELQKKAATFIGEQASIAQFLDRDTRPDFASTVMIPSLQAFLGNPDDIDGLVKSIEEQKKAIFVG